MENSVQEFYQRNVRSMSEQERLQLAALILNELSHTPATEDETAQAERKGDISRFFGAWESGNQNSADNERIDADLASEYGATHDED